MTLRLKTPRRSSGTAFWKSPCRSRHRRARTGRYRWAVRASPDSPRSRGSRDNPRHQVSRRVSLRHQIREVPQTAVERQRQVVKRNKIDCDCGEGRAQSPALFFLGANLHCVPRKAAPDNYNSRRAVATGSRAARMAGSRPPMRPIVSAKTMPFTSNSGVILKAKARLEKV
jgi:hypothetical protein